MQNKQNKQNTQIQKLQELLAKTSNPVLQQKLEEAIRKLEKDDKSRNTEPAAPNNAPTGLSLSNAGVAENEAPPPPPPPPPAEGDFNNDGFVGVNDLLVLLSAFSGTEGGDINNDQKIDVQDLLILLSNYGRTVDGLNYPNRRQENFVTSVVINKMEDSLHGKDTYQLGVNLTGNAKNVYALYGDEENSMNFPPAYHHDPPFTANTGGVNPVFIEIFSDSEFDSWLTVGTTDGDPSKNISSTGIDFSLWTEDDEFSTTNGAVFWMDPDNAPAQHVSSIHMGSDVVLAQITIPKGTTHTITANIQGRSNEGGDWYQPVEWVIDTNSTHGCTNPNYLEYNPNATEDDGSCLTDPCGIVMGSEYAISVCYKSACVASEDSSKIEINSLDGSFYCVNGVIGGITGVCNCTCHAGYSGIHCETANACVATTTTTDNGSDGIFYCINGGEIGGKTGNKVENHPITGENVGCTCTDCNTGYSGNNCEIANACVATNNEDNDGRDGNFYCIDNGSESIMNGTIRGTTGNCSCECKPGFTGDGCATNINECVPDPCQNGGTCTDGINKYTCDCKPGYYGDNCQEETYTATLNDTGAYLNEQLSNVNINTVVIPAGWEGAFVKLFIPSSKTLINNGIIDHYRVDGATIDTIFHNYGTITNNGTISHLGWDDVTGAHNYGTITNNDGGVININVFTNHNNGTITNDGIISYAHLAINNALITNHPNGIINNNGRMLLTGFTNNNTIINEGIINNNGLFINKNTIANKVNGTITNNLNTKYNRESQIINYLNIHNNGKIFNGNDRSNIYNKENEIINYGNIYNNNGGTIKIFSFNYLKNGSLRETGTIINNVGGEIIIWYSGRLINYEAGYINNKGTIINQSSTIDNKGNFIGNYWVDVGGPIK